MKRSLLISGVVTWLVMLAAETRADDWPQWLGPQRDGVWREDGLVDKLPAGGPSVRWRAKIGGGYAGPAVANGKVFVADYLTEGDTTPSPQVRNKLKGQERVWCLSAATGELLWKHAYDCDYEVSYPAGPRVTPTVVGDHVYTLGAMGNLLCLSVEDGRVLWQKDFKKDYGAKTPTWGFCGHPLVDGDRLVCLVGGQGSVAVAFNRFTGEEIWRALSAPEPGYAPPTMIEAGGQRQLVIFHSQSVNSLNPETGEVYWSEPLTPNYGMSIIAPVQGGDYLFAAGIRKQGLMFKLNRSRPAADVIWAVSNDLGIGPVHSPAYMQGGHLYGVDGDGELRCVDVETGERLWTTYAATTGARRLGSATAFVVRNGDRCFIFNEKGELLIARLTPEKFEEISRAKILEPTGDAFGRKVVWSHPAFAERCMFVRNDQEIVCVSLAK